MRRELYTFQNKTVKERITKASSAGTRLKLRAMVLQKVTYLDIKSMKIEENVVNREGRARGNQGRNPPRQPAEDMFSMEA
jgi:hypothetical protein